MAQVKVTTRFKIIDFIDRFMDGTTVSAIGDTIVDTAKEMISEGQSPVRGHGRFARYKDRTKYPGDLKPARPVNLNLTGEMLKGFGFKYIGNDTIQVGMISGSSDRKEVARYHNSGTDNMAMRRFIPQDGEEWAISIMREIRDVYGKRLATLVKASNKKN